MRWWESVQTGLSNLGGIATLSDLYKEVRRVRTAHGDTTPNSTEEVIRKELEYNSSDSTNWQGTRDLFFSVHGIGKGVWGLRSMIADEPSAIDLELDESEGTAPTAEVTICRIIRDTAMTRKIKALHRSVCQICGTSIDLPNGRKYAEAHHIIPLGAPHFGPDVPSNIIVVCPNHHAMLDLGCTEIGIGDIANVDGHQISNKSIDYHNEVIVPSAKKAM